MTRIAVRPEMCSVAGPVTLPHSFKCSPTAQALPQTGLSRSPATRHTPPDPGTVLLPEGSPPVAEQLLNCEQLNSKTLILTLSGCQTSHLWQGRS